MLPESSQLIRAWVPAVVATPDVSGELQCLYRRIVRSLGPGAPLTAERERYLRLVAQGMSNVDACREVGVHRITGIRWRDGRSMVDSGGRARYYPPIAAEPVVDLGAVLVGGGAGTDR